MNRLPFTWEDTMYDNIEYTNSAELCEQMAAECDTAILAFSTGKDSIAAWLQLRKYFKRIVPYYCYIVPHLRFVEDSLKYYEDFFGQHIYRLPHPTFLTWLNIFHYQTPDRVTIIMKNPMLSGMYWDEQAMGDAIRAFGKLPRNAYVATGVRMADSPQRRISIKNYGAINHNAKKFYPIYDWVKTDIIDAMDKVGVKLPIDYKMFGRTFDGLDYRFIKQVKDWFPEDYERILEWYPQLEVEIARRDGIDTIIHRRREA